MPWSIDGQRAQLFEWIGEVVVSWNSLRALASADWNSEYSWAFDPARLATENSLDDSGEPRLRNLSRRIYSLAGEVQIVKDGRWLPELMELDSNSHEPHYEFTAWLVGTLPDYSDTQRMTATDFDRILQECRAIRELIGDLERNDRRDREA